MTTSSRGGLFARFPLGRTVATPGALDLLTRTGTDPGQVLARHHAGDWGEGLDGEDKQANEDALKHGSRLLSCYLVDGERLWVITEADRSITTLLLPSEY